MAEAHSGDLIAVEVAYALPQQQHLIKLEVPDGCVVEDAIQRSGILKQCPDIDLTQAKVGIWNKLSSLDARLQARDRVEIYRPLRADPKEARRRRAEQAAASD